MEPITVTVIPNDPARSTEAELLGRLLTCYANTHREEIERAVVEETMKQIENVGIQGAGIERRIGLGWYS
jgi:hypothetical protein